MLEIPEARIFSKQLTDTLAGKTIWSARANSSPHGFAWYSGDPAEYGDKLTGLQIGQSIGFGGMVEIEAGDLRIVFNDGINIRYLAPGTPHPKKHQLLLVFGDESALVCTVSMYGGMFLYKEGEDTNGYSIGSRTKISPLTDAFDFDYFKSLRTEYTEKMPSKGFLATEQRVPGLGNGVLQDILFNARIHPARRMNTLSPAEFEGMFHAVKDTLKDMTDKGGRDVERDIFGSPGGYTTILSRNTVGKPCPVCGCEIRKKAYMGGSIYWCDGCQPLEG